MLEENVNLWHAPAEARCITTNGAVRRDGAAVMGAGCAKEAALMDPALPAILGASISVRGNHVAMLRNRPGKAPLVSYPVKHHWREQADVDLIVRSARELRTMAEVHEWERVLVPRPGCGNGRLSWSDVRPLLADVLDDRFVVVHVPARQR